MTSRQTNSYGRISVARPPSVRFVIYQNCASSSGCTRDDGVPTTDCPMWWRVQDCDVNDGVPMTAGSDTGQYTVDVL